MVTYRSTARLAVLARQIRDGHELHAESGAAV